ncbi:suppressor of fused domain protein [Prosthecobacter sp.]|uniref:suppressor of fused domain protein n=1 Tax=Prosthecobacter sp. TaxID=1965333 RepID=UPI003783295E
MNPLQVVQRYAAVFWRAPAVVRESDSGLPVLACWFPALKKSFWKGLFAEAHDMHVWITAGLSSYQMAVPPDLQSGCQRRIELMALAENAIAGGESGDLDICTFILQLIACHVIEQKIFVDVGHTLNFGEPMSSNSEMTGVLFALPFDIDLKRVSRCSQAKVILSVMPLTAAELAYARKEGTEALIDRFEDAGVAAMFDVFRPSVV